MQIEYLIYAIILLSFPFIFRAAGGGYYAKAYTGPLKRVSFILVSLATSVALMYLEPLPAFSNGLYGLNLDPIWLVTLDYLEYTAVFLGTYFALEAGHGTAFKMGKDPATAQSGRKQDLSFFIDPICKLIRAPLGGLVYCWLFMGLKGLLIGLSLFPAGLSLAILWPGGYQIGSLAIGTKIKPVGTELAEHLTGFAFGLILVLHLV